VKYWSLCIAQMVFVDDCTLLGDKCGLRFGLALRLKISTLGHSTITAATTE